MFVVMFTSYDAFSAEKKKKQNDVDLIENAIIIDGLSMTSNKPAADDDAKDGELIYDDSFDDSIIEKSVSKNGKAASKNEILGELRKKDSRWHYTNYRIRKNDTLWGIAKKFSTSHKLIISANGITGPNQIREGKEIFVPNRNGFFYSVKKGDTLERIGGSSKTTVAAIKSQNPGSSKVLKAGEKIFIPDGIEKKAPVMIAKNTKPKQKVKKESAAPQISESDDAERVAKAKESPAPVQKVQKMAFIWPVKGRITSGFGSRCDPFSGKRQFHNGLDIGVDIGTPVKASADGEVIFSGWKDDYGNLVVIKHNNGYVTVYGHNSQLKVKEGDEVKRGDIISLSGMTGLATGGHVHFEIQKYQIPLNPVRMLK
jgi:murein DD-endopeptidase MepM/ murein hydrolase activator NlpD